MGLTVRYFDTPERYGWYYLNNDTWFYGGSTEEECHKSIAECDGRIVKKKANEFIKEGLA